MKCFKCATPLPDNSRFCSSCGTDVSGGTSGGQTVAADADHELENQLREAVGGDFVIERELGRGGMAAVFLGYDVHLERPVAIKVLPPELTYGAGSVERFRREAKTAATLDHPNIIPVYRVSTGGKLFWYVMKYLDGEALSTIIERDGAMALDVTASVLSQTADALQYAHEHGVIHRDVKPANVMLDSRGRVIVTDFGIAKALTAQSMTGSGAMMGTPYYMSPEQCTGKKTITPAADQYSLGIMVYQMLSAHVPFTGESVIDVVKQHCMDPVPPLAVLVPSIPPGVVTVVEQALSKAPEDRFPSVLHFSEAFRAAAGLPPLAKLPAVQMPAKRTSSTVALGPAHSPYPPAAVPPQLASPAPAVAKRRKGVRTAVIATLVVVGAAGGGTGAYLWLGARKGQEVPAPAADRTAPTPGATQQQAGPPPQRPESVVALRPETGASRSAPPPKPQAERAAPASQLAIVTLTGVPARATIRVDGSRARGSVLRLEPGVTHRLEVQSGTSVWHSGALALSAGERRSIPVVMPTPGVPAAQPGAPQAPVAAQQASPLGRQAPASGQPAAPPLPAGGGAEAMGTMTVSSTPPSTLYLNNQRVGRTPQRNVPVRAGTVTARFEVQDSTGTMRCQVRTFTVVAGQLFNAGIVPLIALGPC